MPMVNYICFKIMEIIIPNCWTKLRKHWCGYFAAPFLVDVNRDGLLDLLIGEQDGTINYCV